MFSLDYWLILLIPAIITKTLVFVAELARSTGIHIKKEKVEIETHPVTVEAKISKESV